MKKFLLYAKNLEKPRLLGMLDRAIGGLVENEICSYCKIRFDENEKLKKCQSGDFCKSLIFQGLEDFNTDSAADKDKK
ncbi:MAG: hypothetical protein KHX03_08390 [Clostridium sp.]|nr:hypothetical protein [Clostridium sp.]